MRNMVAAAALLLATFFLVTAPPGVAALAREQDQGTSAAEGLVPLERVLAKLRRQYSGDKLDATLVRQGNVVLYEVQWLTREGRKLVITVDAKSGDTVGTQGLPQ